MKIRTHLAISGLIAVSLILLVFSPALATSFAQFFDWPVYIPVVIKEELPTPTPTSTQPPAPTATSTSIPAGVTISGDTTAYVDSIDYLHVIGEVINNTGNQIRFVKIVGNFFDVGGQLVDTDFTYTYLDDLPAHEKTCFHLLLPQPANWASYQFEAPTYSTSTATRANLAILGDSGSINPTFGWYEIIGQVRNDHGSRVQYVSTVGTLFASSGTAIGCDFTYVSSTHLEAGQSSSFKLTFSGRNFSDVASYRVQAEGNP